MAKLSTRHRSFHVLANRLFGNIPGLGRARPTVRRGICAPLHPINHVTKRSVAQGGDWELVFNVSNANCVFRIFTDHVSLSRFPRL